METAVTAALGNVETTVTEWYDYEGGQPYHFKVLVTLFEQGIVADDINRARQIILETKNTRSHLDHLGITVALGSNCETRFRPCSACRNTMTIWPEEITDLEQELSLNTGAVAHWRFVLTTIAPEEMSQQFRTVTTNAGRNAVREALTQGKTVKLSHMSVGDGGGNPVTPLSTMTKLVNERFRAQINDIVLDPATPDLFTAELFIPQAEGGWYIREVGLWMDDGTLFAVGNTPLTEKPDISSGAATDLLVRLIIRVLDAATVSIEIDPAQVLATREYVDHQARRAQQGRRGARDAGPQERADQGRDGAHGRRHARSRPDADRQVRQRSGRHGVSRRNDVRAPCRRARTPKRWTAGGYAPDRRFGRHHASGHQGPGS